MPLYVYQHPYTKEIIEINQAIDQEHIYIDKHSVKWNRIFTTPEINTNGSIKADFSSKQFSEFTKKTKGSIGDLWDRSRELSEKREKIYGKDPVKEKYKKDWSKKRKNRRFIE